MKYFFAALAAFLSFSAFGNVTKEVCYADKNLCGLYTLSDSGAVVAITVTVPVDIAVQREFEDLGITIYRNYPDEYEKVKAAARVAETRITTTVQEEDDLASIPDEDWNLIMSSLGCVGSVIGCGIAAFTAAESGGLTLVATRVGCAIAGGICTDTYRNYEKWRRYQAKKKAEEERLKAEREQAKQGTGSGSGSGATPTPAKPIALPPAPPPPPPPPPPRNPKVTIEEYDL